VANVNSNTVSVIATATNTVTTTIPVVGGPNGVAVTPDGSTVYVTNAGDNTVSAIATATNTITATIPVGSFASGVAVTPDGSKAYVANGISNTVSVIDTATNEVTASVPVGSDPAAFGIFIQPSLFLRTLGVISAALASGGIDSQGLASSLTQKITNAKNAPDKKTRDNIINAFLNEVNAQAGKHINTSTAAILILDAVALLGLP
jgi:YVTN family beta-propeller protein